MPINDGASVSSLYNADTCSINQSQHPIPANQDAGHNGYTQQVSYTLSTCDYSRAYILFVFFCLERFLCTVIGLRLRTSRKPQTSPEWKPCALSTMMISYEARILSRDSHTVLDTDNPIYTSDTYPILQILCSLSY